LAPSLVGVLAPCRPVVGVEAETTAIAVTTVGLKQIGTLDTVRESLHENVNVTSLAKRLRVTREHLTRVFRDTTGRTPHQYVVQQKVMLACRLLKTTDLTCKEIAARIGYGTHSKFTRSFRSVSRYRNHAHAVGAALNTWPARSGLGERPSGGKGVAVQFFSLLALAG